MTTAFSRLDAAVRGIVADGKDVAGVLTAIPAAVGGLTGEACTVLAIDGAAATALRAWGAPLTAPDLVRHTLQAGTLGSNGDTLCLPVRVHDRVPAVVLARAADEQARALVEHLVGLASLHATHLARLEQAEQITIRKRFVSDTVRMLAEAPPDTGPLMDLLTRRIGETLGDLCTLRLVSADGAWILPEGSVWHADADVRAAAARILAQPQRVGDGITGRVAATGEALIVPRLSQMAATAMTAPMHRWFVEQARVESLVVVPLLAGRVVGVLGLSRNDAERPYTREEADLVLDLADHAGLAIANSQLLRSLRTELAERERTEQRLRRTEEQLRHAQKMEAIGRLAGGVAHDFNNLLSVVLSYAQLLLNDLPENSPLRSDLAEIRTAGWRAADLTHQLLAFSRQQVLEPKIVDLNGILVAMGRMLQRLVGENVQVRTATDRDLPTVRVDPSHMEQVVMNLVVNARDAMPHGGTILLETAAVHLDQTYADAHVGVKPGVHAMLAISDTGVGMDKETLARIFDPFFTTKAPGAGTGLGLSTVHGIVEQNGGSIFVYSEVGAGTTFKIYLPAADAEGVSEPVAAAPPTSMGGHETVLLVEDDEQVRSLARGILVRNGYDVLAAANAAEALPLAAAHAEIQLLLTDVVLPHMSGRELAEQLCATRPHLRVLYMSGYTENAILHHRVLDQGVVLLEKPITPELLLRKVREVLDADRG